MDLRTIVYDGTGRLRWLWRFGIFGGGMLAIMIGINIVVMIGLIAYLSSVDPSAMNDPERLKGYGESPELMFMAGPVVALLSLGWVVVCRRFLDKRTIVSMGMGRPDSKPENSLWAGFLLGAVLIAGSAAVLWLAGAVEFTGATLSWQLFVYFPVLLLMAFQEELVCRSYLLQNFVDVDRPIVGLVVTSLLFGIVHGMNPAVWSSPLIFVNLVLAGVLLGLAYLVGRGVWFATALHFGWNLFQGPVFGFAVSGISTDSFLGAKVSPDASPLLTGGAFGLEGSLLCTGLMVVVIVYFLLIGRLRGEPIVPPPAAPSEKAG